jgi:hypothetical protein
MRTCFNDPMQGGLLAYATVSQPHGSLERNNYFSYRKGVLHSRNLFLSAAACFTVMYLQECK